MSLDAGAAVDVELGPVSLKALTAIDAGINTMTTLLKSIRNIENAYQFGPVEVALRGAKSSDSGGDTLIIDLGGPSSQRLWQLRRITIGGPLWTTEVGGSALVVVSANQPSTAPPLPDINDEVASLPSNGFYSTGQVIVRHPNHLFVVILTPDESTGYAVGGQATDMPDKREPIDVER